VNRLTIHPHDEADQSLCVRKEAQDIISLFCKLGSIYIDKPDVIGTGLNTELAKLTRVEP